MNVRMHCKDSSAPDAAKVHCKDLGGALHAAKVHCKDHAAKVKLESNQALAKFQGRMGSATEERRRAKQSVKKATVLSGSGGGGRRKYRNQKDFMDRVVAPISFGFLLLHIMITSRKS